MRVKTDGVSRNGFECLTMERKHFLRIVHEQIPDKSFIKTGKRVVDVIDNDDGVIVKLQDGTQEEGDMLIGCDGVHSTVRELLWRDANLAQPDYITTQEKRCKWAYIVSALLSVANMQQLAMVTTYRSLVGVAKTVPGIGLQCMNWVCHSGLSFLILVQPDKTYFFVNWKMPQKMRWPSKAKWSNEEAERAAASVVELPISDSTVFGELWKHKIRAHLIGLEEGIFEHWHHGRMALAGDSVHKMTPNFALGAMCALESATVLINGIHDMHSTLGPGQHPTKSQISRMFQRYQEERMPRIKAAFDATALITRMHACDGPYHWFAMRCVFPATGMKPYADALGHLCSGAPKIKFLPVEYKKSATIKWQDEPDHVPGKESMRPFKWGKGRNDFVMDIASILSFIFLVCFVCGSVLDRSLSNSSSLGGLADDLLLRRGAQVRNTTSFRSGSQPNFSPIAGV